MNMQYRIPKDPKEEEEGGRECIVWSCPAQWCAGQVTNINNSRALQWAGSEGDGGADYRVYDLRDTGMLNCLPPAPTIAAPLQRDAATSELT